MRGTPQPAPFILRTKTPIIDILGVLFMCLSLARSRAGAKVLEGVRESLGNFRRAILNDKALSIVAKDLLAYGGANDRGPESNYKDW